MNEISRSALVYRIAIAAHFPFFRIIEKRKRPVPLWRGHKRALSSDQAKPSRQGDTSLAHAEDDLKNPLLADDSDFIRRLAAAAGREHATGIPLNDRMPDFTCFFGKREGVIPVGLAVMLSNIGGTPLSSRAQIAKRFDLSKTHVSNMIAEGSRLGFFVTDETGTPRATSHNHLRDSYGRFISIELAFYARHIRPTPKQACRAPLL